ncbi:MAG: galactonate dehydratase [Deinococcota bacterium]
MSKPKLTKLETFLVAPRWLFVRLEDDTGQVGWGEASLEGYAEAVIGAFEAIQDRILGTNPNNIEDIWQVVYRGGFYRGGPVLMSALSGLDQALWDMKGKRLGVPAWELLGGKVRERVQAYGWIGGDRPSDVATAAQARKAQGFKAVKMNGTAELGYLDDVGKLMEVAARVEAVTAEGLAVGIDFHGRIHRAMAKQLVKILEPLSPLFVEEPLLSEHPEALAELSHHSSIPIALGERLYTRWDVKPFLEGRFVDILQPDLSHAGGISETRRIATMAEAYDVAIAPHCPLGPLALASSLQVAACSHNVVLQEMSLGIHYNQGADLYTYLDDASVLTPDDGFLTIPSAPGLGVTINEDAVRAAATTPHRWRNDVWRLADGSFAEW